MTQLPPNLPITPILPQLTAYLELHCSAILHASPGSGKTTRVPPALLQSSFCEPNREIWVLEPRRLAAKYAAYRVAQEMGEPIGKTVGYHFRFEKVVSRETRIHFLTEGMLIRKLIADPRLERVAAVILDEFHERHLHGDTALSYLARLQSTERPDLRIVLMSATLDAESASQFLGNCSIFKVEAPVYPIEIQHLPSPLSKSLETTVRETVTRAIREEDPSARGDFLVFLPGMAEIRRVHSELQNSTQGFLILPLHGDLSREEQDRAIQPIPGSRKIILSTNVAETSLTIEGLSTVIDSGLHRIASFSWWSGVPSLRTRPISRASAIQRAGRAGRTGPGRCYRLYTQAEFSSRPAFETPEIQRADLCQTVLELKSLGVEDLERFSWFESPSLRSLQSAQELLYRLGALNHPMGASSLTPVGKRMAQIAAHPRIARMLIEAEKKGILDQAATLAAMITEGLLDPPSRSLAPHEVSNPLEWLHSAAKVPVIRKAHTHLISSFESRKELRTTSPMDSLRFALLTGFPDRVARKRKLGNSISRGTARDGSQMTELIFSSGGSALVKEAGIIAEGDTFVTLDIQEQQALNQARSQIKVRAVTPIQSEWLFDLEPSMIEEKTETTWDTARERVKTISQLSYDELILLEEEEDARSFDATRTTQVLLKSALGIDPNRVLEMKPEDWITALTPISDAELLENAMTRLSLAVQHLPQLLSQKIAENWHHALAQNILSLIEGKTRLSELKEIDWENALVFAFFQENTQKMDHLIPTHIQLNPKRRVKIHYQLGQTPWIESRLQDFFGMKQGPTLLNGKISIALHLLAPNQRAVQITTDLSGFWERTYPELRTALSRRYPRHAWPENPLRMDVS